MKILLNGEEYSLESDSNIQSLLTKHQIDANKIAIELNREIIDPEHFEQIMLQDGDQIEIVEFVGGG